MANVSFRVNRLISGSLGQQISEKYLAPDAEKVNLDEEASLALEMSHEFGWINAINSLAKGVLDANHPSEKDYSQWSMRSLDLFRGGAEDGTSLTHVDVVGDNLENPELSTLSFVYISLSGAFTASFRETLPAFEDVSSETSPAMFEYVPYSPRIVRGVSIESQGVAITEWTDDHIVHIHPGSVAMRLSFI